MFFDSSTSFSVTFSMFFMHLHKCKVDFSVDPNEVMSSKFSLCHEEIVVLEPRGLMAKVCDIVLKNHGFGPNS